MAAAIFILTFAAAFCSMSYEFLLAQTLSALLGQTLVRYFVTFSLFLLSLGLGSLSTSYPSQDLTPVSALRKLFKVELLLSFLGPAFPIVTIFLDYYFGTKSGVYWIDYLLIILIGFLSGIELPLFFQMTETMKGKNRVNQILSFDYFGILASSVLFPFFFLPVFGVLSFGFLIGLLNLLAAFFIIILIQVKFGKSIGFISSALGLILFIILLTSFYHSDSISEVLIQKFYLKGIG